MCRDYQMHYISTQLNLNLFANYIAFDNGYMKCAHKKQSLQKYCPKFELYRIFLHVNTYGQCYDIRDNQNLAYITFAMYYI